MLKPNFLLTHKIPIVIDRKSQGRYDNNGEWIEGGITQVTIQGNIQPLRPHELLMLPESERSKSWWKLYSADPIRVQQEGQDGWDSDEFYWKGYKYKVMKLDDWSEAMSILEHFKAYCTREEVTPN